MIKGRARRFLALGGVLALCFALLAGGPYESKPPPFRVLGLCSEPGATCVFSFDPPRSPRHWQPLSAPPPPTRLATNEVPGCARGSNRPVLNTTTPTAQATFAAPVDVTFELAPLDGSAEPIDIAVPPMDGTLAVWESDENGLVPGRTYRWRMQGTSWDGIVGSWSEWCEFTIAPGLVDLTAATDITTIQELGVEPLRRYPVKLPARQWELVLDAIDVEGDDVPADGELVDEGELAAHARQRRITAAIEARPGTLTLTGNDWALVAVNLAGMGSGGGDGSPYWKVLDRISAQLGGPKHPLRTE